MQQDALEILIIDENAIDNIVHKTLFLNCGRDLLVKDLPCAEYAIANIESRLASNSYLPDLVIQSIDFRNANDYNTMHRYLKYQKSLHGVKHFGMSCSEDKGFSETYSTRMITFEY